MTSPRQKQVLLFLFSFVLVLYYLNTPLYGQDNPQTKEVDKFLAQGISYYKSNNIGKALKAFNDALAKSQEIEYQKGMGYANLQLGALYLLIDPARALGYLTSAQRLIPILSDNDYEIQVNGMFGEYYYLAGDFKESIRSFNKGIDLCLGNFHYLALLKVKRSLVLAFIGEMKEPISEIMKIIEKAKIEKDRLVIRTAYFILGMINKSNGDFIEAIKNLNASLLGCNLDDDEYLSGEIGFALGEILTKTQRAREAIERLQISYDHYKNIRANLRLGLCSYHLSQAYFQKRDVEKAKRYFEESIKLLSTLEYYPAHYLLYFNLSDSLISDYKSFSSAGYLEKGKIIISSALFTKYRSAFYAKLGRMIFNSGDLVEAERCFTISENALGEIDNIFMKILVLLEISQYRSATGDQSLSREYLLSAKYYAENGIYTQLLAENIYPKLARSCADAGDIIGAYNYIHKIWEGPIFNIQEIHISLMWILGQNHFAQGMKEDALKDFEMAYEASRGLTKITGNRLMEAQCLIVLASQHEIVTKEHRKAIDLIEKSLSILNDYPDSLTEQGAYTVISNAYTELKDYEKALVYIDRAIGLSEISGNKNILGLESLYKGRIIRELGRHEEALVWIRKAYELKEGSVIKGLSKGQRATYLEMFSELDEDILLELEYFWKRTKDSHYVNEAFIISESARSRALLDEINENVQTTHGGIDKDLIKRRADLVLEANKVGIIYNEMNTRGEPLEKTRPFWEKLTFINEQIEQLEKEIVVAYPNYENVFMPKAASIDNIKNNVLKESNEGLVEYYLGKKNSFAFLLTKENISFVRIDKNKDSIEASIQKVLGIYQGATDQGQILPLMKLDIKELHALYLDLFSPFIEQLKSIKKLIVIPHRSLYYLPFETLVIATNSDSVNNGTLLSEYSSVRYIINEMSISYAPSGYFLISKGKALAAPQGQNGDILLLSNPISIEPLDIVKNSEKNMRVPNEPEIARRYSRGFSPLPFSEKECKEIGNQFKEPLLLDGRNATKKRFLEEAPHYEIIHISTHGLLDETNPLYSGLVFAPDSSENSQSILYAYELFNVSLSCDLVTLSACETGLGQKIQNILGEGVYGLSRMLLASGAGAVVSSLWRVADESTAILMVEFYKNMQERGLSKGEALRQAKLFLMKQTKKIGNRSVSYGHPFFWAPFILIGNQN